MLHPVIYQGYSLFNKQECLYIATFAQQNLICFKALLQIIDMTLSSVYKIHLLDIDMVYAIWNNDPATVKCIVSNHFNILRSYFISFIFGVILRTLQLHVVYPHIPIYYAQSNELMYGHFEVGTSLFHVSHHVQK